MFIGREKELAFLQDKYNDNRGQLIVLYSRRRVGKTETLRELGISRDSKEYLVEACKFKKTPFSYSEYLDTKAKLTPLKKTAKFYYALVSENG